VNTTTIAKETYGESLADAAPLLIAVEATRLAREVRGIGRYVRALLPRFLEQRPGTRIILYVKPRHVAQLAAEYAARPEMNGLIDVRPVGEMRRSRADVFWYPWNVASPTPRRGAVVVTIHDVAPLVLPDPRFWKFRKNWRWRRRYRVTAERATLLVVDSRFTASEVTRELGVAHSRMRVVHLAADDATMPDESGDDALLAELGVRRPFVLTVGAGDRRKNIALVERAMPRVLPVVPELSLVLAGPRTDPKGTSATQAPWVRTLGFVSDDALVALYRTASCLVMPSRYEGFGLPVIEAMQLGTPVICARTSSLPEVGGGAVLWVDPDDDAQLAAAIASVLCNARVSADLRAAGLQRAAHFTWNETASRTLAAFDEAIQALSARP
jgi:glycosyltransferase involved in cell wall biosynthesis